MISEGRFPKIGSLIPKPISGIVLGVWLIWLGLPILAQLEPCGFYELDGVPGYGLPDLYYTASHWHETGSLPDIPDYDGDGMVTLLDLAQQASCVDGLTQGLLGRYYGFEDGDPDQEITFPDFDNLPGNPEPVVVRPTEILEVLEGFRGFMDSEMRHQFGAVFEGYLFVPETANYTLHIFGIQGMRLILDGTQILAFDGSPREDSTTLPLTYGLHPLRIDFYVASQNARILFDWSSDGTVIGAQAETVATQYLYHESRALDPNTLTEIEILFSPPSGSRVPGTNTTVSATVMSPNSEVGLSINGVPKVLIDGVYEEEMVLDRGLNKITFVATDGDGRVEEKTYSIYSDFELLPETGLAASFYAREWYNTPIPSTEGLEHFANSVNPGTQLENNADRITLIGGHAIRGGAIVHLEGALHINTPGLYQFRLNDLGGLLINGEFVAGIGYSYADQWTPRGEVFLEAGNHHWHLVSSDPSRGPEVNVFWSRDGGTETQIPDSSFIHGPSHVRPLPTLQFSATGGRFPNGQMAEYLFKPGATYADTSGKHYDLWPDPRAIQRTGGGVTYQTGGGMVTEQGAIQMINLIKINKGLSLEVDFVYDKDPNNWESRELISLTDANWGTLVRIYAINDMIRFDVFDDQGQRHRIEVDNIINQGARIHVVGTFAQSKTVLYIDGVRWESFQNIFIQSWPNLARLNIGQRYNRRSDPDINDRQMFGTFLVAACYGRTLTQVQVQNNLQRNRSISGAPPPLPPPTQVTFPPAGTTQAELDEAHHVLNRLSFGPSPESINRILTMGIDPWIAEQMNPASIDDSAFETLFNSPLFEPKHIGRDLQAQTLFRMTLSKRQLLEVMAWFWENHFSTEADKVDDLGEELAENERFRSLAFGNFVDLLLASAINFPMTEYLDSSSNIVGAVNENYAREILELHTHGVNNGYVHQDIVEAARCFTGWSTRGNKFHFDPGRHDYGEKNLLGITIPAGGGISDGLQLIQHIALRPQTADFITWKLCQVFVADDPPADVWAAASAAFQASGGNIAQTLNAIFSHARFRTDTAYRGNKVKTPLEFLTSITRLTEAYPVAGGMIYYLRNMGMDLFNYIDPTGFAEEGVAWIDTNSMLERWNLTNQVTSNRGNTETFAINIKRFVQKYGATTANELLDLFTNATTHGTEPPGVRAIMESWLTDDDPGNFVLTDETLDFRVRQTLGLYLRLAEMNSQ